MADEGLIDTHIHLWDRAAPGLTWSWLEAGFTYRKWRAAAEPQGERFSVPELREVAAGCGVVGLVHGHSADPIDDPVVETTWLEQVADTYGTPDALVGKCTLAAPDAPDVLHRHAAHPRLRGVRDPDAMRELDVDAIAPAMDVVVALGLSVEFRRDHRQFAVLHEVAQRWPQATVVLSHACLPLERNAEQLAQWHAAMTDLARRPNVVCKISALAGASDPDWTVDSIRPYLLGAVDAFGPSRCMLGSNWPVDRQFGTYARLVEAYRAILAALDPAERAAVLSGCARRVYGLS